MRRVISVLRAVSSRLARLQTRHLAVCLAYIVAVLLLDTATKGIERMTSVSAFFPADGLAFALLYVGGLWFTPVVFLAYALSSTLLFDVSWPLAVGASLVGAAIQAGSVALCRGLLRGDLGRGRLVELSKFLLAVGVMALSGGFVLRLTLVAAGDLAPAQATAAFFTMSIGLATGALMIASPAALAASRARSWLRGGRWRDLWSVGDALFGRRLALDAFLLLAATVLTVSVAFSSRTREFEPLYLCFAPIILLALRRGLPGAAAAILFVDVAVVVAFRVQRLPPPELDKIQVLQFALSLMGLILGTVVTEREGAQAAARAADGLRHDVELARRVAQRNQELRLVLDSVNEGLLGVTADGALTPERSAMVERWFGAPGDKSSLVDYLTPIDRIFAENFEVNYELLKEDVLPVELCLAQLPTRLRHQDREFAVNYLQLGEGGPRNGLLLVINDITVQLQAAQQDVEQREQLAAFKGFTRDRVGFLALFDEASQIVEDVTSATRDLAAQKRLVHTLKASASTAGLTSIAQICHDLEDELAENGCVRLTPLVRALGQRWLLLTDSLREFREDRGAANIELPVVEFDRLCEELARDLSPSQAAQRLARLRFEPVQRHLERLAGKARMLSQRLGKGQPVTQVEGDQLRLDPARWAPLFLEMVHLIGNSVDHGFESAEERLAAGKPSQPGLRLGAYLREHELAIEIEDDGRGIDWQAVRRSAVGRGLPAETERDLTAALFAPGVTSRDQVTSTSGRGVGLAAVDARVQALGGRITVTSRPGAGTCWKLSFPLSSLSPYEVAEATFQQQVHAGTAAS